MFEIIQVPEDAYELSEALGTKFKFWYTGENRQRYLFKEVREGTGEHWSEKICCEIASMLGLPHAHYNLAIWKNRYGVVTPSFVDTLQKERLIHGNEILKPDVSPISFYKRRHHLIRKVTSFLKIINPPRGTTVKEIKNANDAFIGYLMFDVLVGNADRHDENWGMVLTANGVELAPSYDHASSLGREIRDEERAARLITNDIGYSVSAYACKARSGLYLSSEDRKTLTTIEAYKIAAETSPIANEYWLSKLKLITDSFLNEILMQISDDIMTPHAKEFALQLVLTNKDRLEREEFS